MSTAGSPRRSATSIAAWGTSKDESRAGKTVSTRRTIDAVGRGGGLTASRPPRPPGTSSSARPSPRRRPPSRTTCRRGGGLSQTRPRRRDRRAVRARQSGAGGRPPGGSPGVRPRPAPISVRGGGRLDDAGEDRGESSAHTSPGSTCFSPGCWKWTLNPRSFSTSIEQVVEPDRAAVGVQPAAELARPQTPSDPPLPESPRQRGGRADTLLANPATPHHSALGSCKCAFHFSLTHSQKPSTGPLPHTVASSSPIRVSMTLPTSNLLPSLSGQCSSSLLP